MLILAYIKEALSYQTISQTTSGVIVIKPVCDVLFCLTLGAEVSRVRVNQGQAGDER